MNIQEFYKELEKFDWYYSYSDSHKVWKAGETKYKELVAVSQTSDEHKKLFSEFVNYRCNGGAKPEVA